MLFAFNYRLICGNDVAKGVNPAASRNFLNGWCWSVPEYGLLASPVLLLAILLNETPQFLIKQRRIEEAKVALSGIRRSGAEAELQQLALLVENEDLDP